MAQLRIQQVACPVGDSVDDAGGRIRVGLDDRSDRTGANRKRPLSEEFLSGKFGDLAVKFHVLGYVSSRKAFAWNTAP